MATPTILFNNSTGSDTAASGAGPATALSGTSASYSGSVFTLDGSPDLSGVATDGSHVIWVDTSTGRQFFTINAVNDGSDTVTVDDAPAGTSTGLTWGLGGKRATIDNADSRNIFTTSWKNGWEIELEYTGTNYSLTSAISLFRPADDATLFIRGTGGTRVVIEQTANTSVFTFSDSSTTYYLFLDKGLKLVNSNGTKSSAYGVIKTGSNTGGLIARDIIFGDATNTLLSAVSWGGTAFGGIRMTDCIVTDTTSTGINTGSASVFWINRTTIKDCGGVGINLFGGYTGVISDCLIYGNSGIGIQCDPQGLSFVGLIERNIIDGNTSHGIGITSTFTRNADIRFNVLTSNGGYGINSSAAIVNIVIDYNAYGSGSVANTSGDVNGVTAGDNAVTLTADPYVDSANDDFNLNNDAGGGAALRAVKLTLT